LKCEKERHGQVGPPGPPGPQGKTGAAGPQGPQGKPGISGPQGPKGDIGPAGPQGERGPRGSQGATGPQGEQGPKGDAGETGPQGTNGTSPHIGINGNWFIGTTDTGVKAQGDEGPVGQPGATGDIGPQGPPGPEGPAYKMASAVLAITPSTTDTSTLPPWPRIPSSPSGEVLPSYVVVCQSGLLPDITFDNENGIIKFEPTPSGNYHTYLISFNVFSSSSSVSIYPQINGVLRSEWRVSSSMGTGASASGSFVYTNAFFGANNQNILGFVATAPGSVPVEQIFGSINIVQLS